MATEAHTEQPSADVADVRREQPVRISWSGGSAKIGSLYVGDEFWGAIEWSAKREAWCIEDAEGKCLRHVASIRAETSSRSKAETLAREMIRDGRLPTPERAKAEHNARRVAQAERRARQPAEIARKAAKAEEMQKSMARWDLEYEEGEAKPLWEALHEVFNLADPDLWRSNSFAMLRPRLVLHLRAAIAAMEHERSYLIKRRRELADMDAKLAKARTVLTAMEASGS